MTIEFHFLIIRISRNYSVGVVILLLCAFAHGYAQNGSTVSGKVTDAATGQPLPFVSVFLANTMIGTRTADDGTYKLENIPQGKYDLMISSVGYNMKRAALSIVTNIPGLNVALTPRVDVLKETVVKTSKGEYLRNIKMFKAQFLGQTKNAEYCTIKNLDDIELSFDHETNVLVATADQPIEVENKALGYRVFYILQQFTYDLNKHLSTLKGVIRFERLDPGTPDSDLKFAKERDRAYHGSLIHLMRTLRSGKFASNEFDVFIWRRTIDKKTGAIGSNYNWHPINGYMFHQIGPDSAVRLRVAYMGDTQEYNYSPKDFKYMSPQVSTFECMKHGLVIHENGYYDDQADFFLDEYLAFRTVIGDLLPYDYQPTITQKEQQRMDKIEVDDALRWARKKEY